jgi:hypothetical protein
MLRYILKCKVSNSSPELITENLPVYPRKRVRMERIRHATLGLGVSVSGLKIETRSEGINR